MGQIKSHILITGCFGFLGRHLAQALKTTKKYRVIGLDLLNVPSLPEQDPVLPDGISGYIQSSMSSIKELADAFNAFQIEGIFHLAGLASSNFDEVMEANFVSTQNLLQAVRLVGPTHPPKIVFASSSSVYGFPKNIELPVTETQALNPISNYGKSKASADELCQNTKDLPIIVARLFNLIGPGQRPPMFCPVLATKFIEALKNPNQTEITIEHLMTARDFVDARDAAQALLKLFESDAKNETVNICSGRATPLQYIFDIFSKIVNQNTGRTFSAKITKDRLDPTDLPFQVGCVKKLQRLTNFLPSTDIQTSLTDLFKEIS